PSLSCRLLHSASLFYNDTAPTAIYTLSLHDALPISLAAERETTKPEHPEPSEQPRRLSDGQSRAPDPCADGFLGIAERLDPRREDRKSTRLNSSHVKISYAVFCLKKKKDRHVESGHK